jgi:hypothetical protein
VGDDEERETLLRQVLLEPQDAFEVQVVGGLIQEKEVRFTQDLHEDGESLAPATGELGDVLFFILQPAA